MKLELFLAMLLGLYSTTGCNGYQHLSKSPWRYWSSWGCCSYQHHICASTDPTCWSTRIPCCAEVPHVDNTGVSAGWDTGQCHGPCPPFWAHVHPRATSARPNGKLTSEIRSTVLGSQPLLLQMHFWKEAQTLKYLSVREEACSPECFQPWGKRPEEPGFLYLKNWARASLSTGAGNA